MPTMSNTAILPARTELGRFPATAKLDRLVAWLNLYMDQEAGANAENSIKDKARDLSVFLDFFIQATGSGHPDQWTRSMTADYIKQLQREKRSPTTVNRVLATLRHCVRWVHHHRPFLASDTTERINRRPEGQPPYPSAAAHLPSSRGQEAWSPICIGTFRTEFGAVHLAIHSAVSNAEGDCFGQPFLNLGQSIALADSHYDY